MPSIAETVFGPVLSRPELGALPARHLAWWLKLAAFQIAYGALPPDADACWLIATTDDGETGDGFRTFLDGHFVLQAGDGERVSEPVASSIKQSVLQAANRLNRAKLGGMARANRIRASRNGGVGGGVLELQLPATTKGETEPDRPTPAEAAVPRPALSIEPREPRATGERYEGSFAPPFETDSSAPKRNWPAEAGDIWRATRGKPSYARIGAALKEAVAEVGADRALIGWERYCKSEDAKFGEEHFARHWRKHVPSPLTPSLAEAEAAREDKAAQEVLRTQQWHVINGALISGDLPDNWWEVIRVAATDLHMDPVAVGYADLQKRGMAE